MHFFKSVLIGLVAGLLAVVVWILMKIAWSMNIGGGAGVGSIGFYIGEFEVLLAAVAGYVPVSSGAIGDSAGDNPSAAHSRQRSVRILRS